MAGSSWATTSDERRTRTGDLLAGGERGTTRIRRRAGPATSVAGPDLLRPHRWRERGWMIDVAAYVRRIAYAGPLAPTTETLRGLHLAHVLAVPFENLDIGLGRPIALDEAALFDTIVVRRRGGFCDELNGLFAALLRALSFDVALLSARVARPDGGFGPPFDHLTLLVTFPAPEGRRLADVGFGDSFREPLLFQEAIEQPQEGPVYRLTRDAEDWTLLRRAQGDRDGPWEAQYRFTTRPHRWA